MATRCCCTPTWRPATPGPPAATTSCARSPSTTRSSSPRRASPEAMRALGSHLGGRWAEGRGPRQVLVNPATEEPLAEIASGGHDLAAALRFARSTGGAALRGMTFAERGAMLQKATDLL